MKYNFERFDDMIDTLSKNASDETFPYFYNLYTSSVKNLNTGYLMKLFNLADIFISKLNDKLFIYRAYFVKIYISFILGKTMEAIDYIFKIKNYTEVSPVDYFNVKTILVNILLEYKLYDLALRENNEICKSKIYFKLNDPYKTVALLNSSLCYIGLSNFTQASDMFNQAIRLSESSYGKDFDLIIQVQKTYMMCAFENYYTSDEIEKNIEQYYKVCMANQDGDTIYENVEAHSKIMDYLLEHNMNDYVVDISRKMLTLQKPEMMNIKAYEYIVKALPHDTSEYVEALEAYFKATMSKEKASHDYILEIYNKYSEVVDLSQKYSSLLNSYEHDPMTNCYSRGAFEVRKNSKNFKAVVIFDLNNLKKINDQKGHQFGDRHIIDFANLLLATFSDIGDCFRIGGDEFVAVLNTDDSNLIENRLKELNRLPLNGIAENHKFSSGVCIRRSLTETINDCLVSADILLYKAKASTEEFYKLQKWESLTDSLFSVLQIKYLLYNKYVLRYFYKKDLKDRKRKIK